jgi:hypothetical protein
MVEETKNPENVRQKCGSVNSWTSDDAIQITCLSNDIYCGLCDYEIKATAASGFTFSRYDWRRPTDIPWSGTTSSWRWNSFDAGDYTVWAYFVDNSSPDTSITGGPPEDSFTNATSASFTFGTTQPFEVGAYECTLNSTTIPCGSALDLSALPNGPQTLRVQARDPSGNLDPTAAERSWTVDTVPPVVTLSGGPVEGSLTNGRSASFELGVSEAVVGRTCKLNGVAIGCAGSSIQLSSLADREYTLTASATDLASNVGATATRKWIVDTDPPTTALTGGPDNSSAVLASTAEFTIGSDEAGSATCTLDGTAIPCAFGPLTLTGLNLGEHTLVVRATDLAGNLDPATATRSWSIVNPPPAIRDSDGDGILDDRDRCPTQAGGAFDADRDGCPGPYARISISVTASWSSITRKGPKLTGMVVTDAPRGALVEVLCPGKKRCPFAQKIISTGGRINLRRFAGRTLAPRSSVAVKVTLAGMVGDYVVKRVKRPGRGRAGLRKFAKQPLVTLRQCVPQGASAPTKQCPVTG